VPRVEMFVDKDCGGFKRRLVILWDDEARTEIIGKKIVLKGRDGKIYPIGNGSEHRRICREVLKNEGY